MNEKIALSKKAKKTKKTTEELQEASKHIFWGMRYLSERFEFLSRYSNKNNLQEMEGILTSIHDSFLIHARKMIEFLYSSSDHVRDNDLIAEDYFNDPEAWKNLRPKLPDILEEERKNVGKLLAHFTYRLNDYPSGRIQWNTSDVYVGIFIAFQSFLAAVDPSLLYKEFDYLRSENEKIIICYPIYPPIGKPPYQIVGKRDKASGFDMVE